MKLAIVISHPIQHFCPQYASLAKNPALEVKVFFASALGYKRYMDADFGQAIAWNNLRLEEFAHEFLNGGEALPADKDLDAPGLDKALETFAPELILLHGYFQKYQRRACTWARRHGVATAYISDSERRQKRPVIRELLKYPYLRTWFSHIDVFLSVGDANEAYYRHYGVPASKVIRMHFSFDWHFYREAYAKRAELRRTIREKLGVADDAVVLSVVGKLVAWKNQADIIDAMQKMEDAGITANLVILGSGQDMDRLKQKAAKLKKSKVFLPGFVTPEELPGYYAATDIYVHPASIEPHSLAISEAIYMSCPVVLSDRCGSYGPDDDVQEGKNGYVFRCGDAGDLADKIIGLIKDPDARRIFGAYSHALGERFQQRSHEGFVPELLDKLRL